MDKRSAIWVLTEKRIPVEDDTRRFDKAGCYELCKIIRIETIASGATTQGELAEHLGMSRQRLARICVSLEIDREIKQLLKETRSLTRAVKCSTGMTTLS